jgi:hypothetical protein
MEVILSLEILLLYAVEAVEITLLRQLPLLAVRVVVVEVIRLLLVRLELLGKAMLAEIQLVLPTKRRRLEGKAKRSTIKSGRGRPGSDD